MSFTPPHIERDGSARRRRAERACDVVVVEFTAGGMRCLTGVLAAP